MAGFQHKSPRFNDSHPAPVRARELQPHLDNIDGHCGCTEDKKKKKKKKKKEEEETNTEHGFPAR